MNTRVEVIFGNTYCAYCGKILKDKNDPPMWPDRELCCDCEKANEELELYHKLKSLYNMPLPDNLIDLKVEAYRAKLKNEAPLDMSLGIVHIPNHICSTYSTPCDLKTPVISTASNMMEVGPGGPM